MCPRVWRPIPIHYISRYNVHGREFWSLVLLRLFVKQSPSLLLAVEQRNLRRILRLADGCSSYLTRKTARGVWLCRAFGEALLFFRLFYDITIRKWHDGASPLLCGLRAYP